jgi:hypothetical protein
MCRTSTDANLERRRSRDVASDKAIAYTAASWQNAKL